MTKAKQRDPLKTALAEMLVFYGSQREIARAAKVKEPSVSDWYSEKSKPSLRSLLRIEDDSKARFVARQIRPELY